MAFPASQGVLSDALERASRIALQMKARVTADRDRMAVGDVPSTTILDLDIQLRLYRSAFAEIAATPGIAAYAQSQFNDPGLDIAAEFGAMTDAIDATVAWIRTNFPADGNGFLLAQTWGAEGPVDRNFTPAQTAGFRAQLDALIATVG